MIVKIYALRDSKAEAWLQPSFALTDGQALRNFEDTVADPQSMLNKHPEDYSLWLLGSYDDQTGKLSPLDTPSPLGQAVEYKKAA